MPTLLMVSVAIEFGVTRCRLTCGGKNGAPVSLIDCTMSSKKKTGFADREGEKEVSAIQLHLIHQGGESQVKSFK